MLEGVVDPVGDGPVVVQRREHLPDRGQDRVDAANIEKRLLLPGERRVGQILRRRRRPDSERDVTTRAGQLLIGGADLGLQIRRERLGDDGVADLSPGPGELLHVLGVQAGEPAADCLGQSRVADEAAVRLSGRGEPVRHPHAQLGQVRHHLPQGGVLPTDLFEVGQSEFGEPEDIAGHDGLLTRCA
jgi:hypothetical protein